MVLLSFSEEFLFSSIKICAVCALSIDLAKFILRQCRGVLTVQIRSPIFCQTIPIEEAGVTPLPTKFVKYNGKRTSRYAVKSQAVSPAVLP